MGTPVTVSTPVDIEEVEYAAIDGVVLTAQVYRPDGVGPFPAVVEVHGGAWTSGDRTNNRILDTALSQAGIVVVALDFRLAPQWPYPASVADVNAGIRWARANASKLHSKPEWIGALGTSSGAHQMLLNVLRPDHGPYLGAASPGSTATVAYAVACWPIADPLARYRMAVGRNNARLIGAHLDYFGSIETMEEANPQLILDRRPPKDLPPLLLIQGGKDDNVTPDMASRFCRSYRQAGGDADIVVYPDEPHMFITSRSGTPAAADAMRRISNFILDRTVRRGLP
jgi:acetyl esterase